VRRPLTLLASATTVRVVEGAEEIARHGRSYDSGATIEDPTHLDRLLTATQQANASSTRDRLRLAVPITVTLFARLAERGDALRPHLIRLHALLDDYGPQELASAVEIALARDALGAGSITHILETRRRHRGHPPPVPMILPDRPGVRDLSITPHRLESYDDLSRPECDDDLDR
jgi:hypothetical protein